MGSVVKLSRPSPAKSGEISFDQRDLLAHLPQMATWALDVEKDIVVWSPWLKRMLGYNENESPPTWRNHTSLMETPDWELLESAVSRCVREGVPYCVTIGCIHRSGRVVQIEFHGGVSERRDGKVVALSGIGIDRTAEIDARRHLKDAETMLAQTTRISRTGGWTLDPPTGTITWTAEMYRIHGLPRNFDLSLKTFLLLYREQLRGGFAEKLEALLVNGEPIEHEVDFLPRKGGRRWIRLIAEVECEIGGSKRIIGTAQDITSRRKQQAERDLLFSSSQDLLGVKGRDGVFLQVNPAWYRCLGWSIEELSQMAWTDLVHPDDHDQAKVVRGQLDRGEEVTDYVNRLARKGGGYRRFSWRAIPIPEEQKTICILRDVTEDYRMAWELRERKRSFEAVLEHSRAGYWDWWIADGYEYLSPMFKEMLGYADHEMANRPESWRDVVVPEDLPRVRESYRRHIESRGEVRFGLEFRCRRMNGDLIWVVCTGAVVDWDEDGAPLRMVGCNLDITETKVQEAQREDAEHALSIAALDERRRLGYYMHDGVGQLLTSLAMDANRIAGDESYPADLRADMARMLATVRDTHARIRGITRGLVPEDVTTENFVGSLVRLTEACAAGFKVHCDLVLTGSVPLERDFVALQLYLVVQEAILNAVRHGRPARIRVEVGDDDEGSLRLRIHDDGQGIESAESDDSPGVGLRSMRARARSCGGRLLFRAAKAGGTEVLLTLDPTES